MLIQKEEFGAMGDYKPYGEVVAGFGKGEGVQGRPMELRGGDVVVAEMGLGRG